MEQSRRRLFNAVINKCPKCHIRDRIIIVDKSETGIHGCGGFLDYKGREHIHSKRMIYEHYMCEICWHRWASRRRNTCSLCGWIQKE